MRIANLSRAMYRLIQSKNTPLVSQRGIEDDSILFSVNC